MTTTVQVTLPRAAILTANGRYHWRKKAAMTAVIRQRFAIAARQGQRLTAPVHCTALLGFSDPGRRRDALNWADTVKAAVDGVVSDAGLLADDDHQHLVGPDLRIDPEPCAKGYVRISLVFEEVVGDGVVQG